VVVLLLTCGLRWQVFINAAVTQAVVHYSELQQCYYVAHEHSAVLCDTRVVMKLLLSWRLWHSVADSVWLLAINALNSLVQTDHPQRQYNVSQLYDAGLIPKMLDIWKVCHILLYVVFCFLNIANWL